MKKAKELLKRLEEIFPIQKGQERHSLVYVAEGDKFLVGLRLGWETFPITLDGVDMQANTEDLIKDIRQLLNEKAVCKNCGKGIRSLEGAPEIPVHSVSEKRLCYDSKGTAEWRMPL